MNPDPDYSAAYCVLRTNVPGLEGHGLTFTIGRGNDLCVAAIRMFATAVEGLDVDRLRNEFGLVWRQLAGESQMRWLGPEKGVVHLALSAVVNALWDLWAKVEGRPVWQLIADLSPEQFVSLIDFRHIRDAVDEARALDILRQAQPGLAERQSHLLAQGYPAYTTSAGWLGYPDELIEARCREALAQGWSALKIKVGQDAADDRRRCALVRKVVGPSVRLMIDANQVWEVDEAIERVRALAEFDPWWIEEPVSPDDVLGHRRVAEAVRPVRVATGEHVHNRIMFKQYLQADALDVVQLDACRLGGINEALATLLLAAAFGKPVCPHAGGVGLCEINQHVSMVDFIAVSGSWTDRMIEHAGQLHHHFVHPIEIREGRYIAPRQPGLGSEMAVPSRTDHEFGKGRVWSAR